MRHHNTRPRMRRNHAPHAAVENARINPTAGEASSSRSAGRVPTQYSIANRMATNTIALPRSCWAQTRRKGTRTMTPGVTSSRMVAGGERRSAAQRATTHPPASLASSAGWNRNGPPRTIHDFVPAAVPAPVPITSVRSSRNSATAYTYGAAHSTRRGDARNTSPARTAPRTKNAIWRCQIVVTWVGTSVCPAEYRAASPNRASATVTPSSGLSSSRTRLNMSGIARERVPRESIARQRVASRRVRERGQDLHFVRRGARLPGDDNRAELRAAGRPALHHADHRLAQTGELLRRQVEPGAGTLGGVHDVGRAGAPVTGEHLVEPEHAGQRLGVLALPDGEVQRHRRGPAPGPVEAVEVLRARREFRRRLAGEVDAGAGAEPPPVGVLEQRREPEFDAELVEVDVAALGDRLL